MAGVSVEAALPAPFGVVLAAPAGAVLPVSFAVVLAVPACTVLPVSAAVVRLSAVAVVPVPAAFPQPVASVIRTETARPIAISRFMDIFLYLLTFTCLYLEVYQIKGLTGNRLRLM